MTRGREKAMGTVLLAGFVLPKPAKRTVPMAFQNLTEEPSPCHFLQCILRQIGFAF
jgi:hypothetical protein